MLKLNPIFIAPPFGQFFTALKVSPVLGSYTLNARYGRFTQVFKTIRPLGRGNWVNRMGLRNPGIDRIPLSKNPSTVLSIAALESSDWKNLSGKLKESKAFHSYAALELNLGCPNASTAPLLPEETTLFQKWLPNLIIKLPPKESSLEQIHDFLDMGINTFHLSNTYPTKRGGLSGQLLRKINLRLIVRAQKRFGQEINIIAGGGVHSIEDAQEYLRLGIRAISLGSICYYPWRLLSVIRWLRKELPGNDNPSYKGD